jgi:signal transduction histidine kinase
MSPDTFVVIGICGMIALAIGLIYFVIMHQRRVFQYDIEKLKSQKEHERQMQLLSQETQEQTMSELASELHDDIGVMLSSVKLFLSKSSPENPDLMNQSQILLDESIQKIRSLSHKLHPSTLQHLGLAIAIQSLLDVIGKSGVVKTQFIAEPYAERIPEQMELSLYRIVQELLNNLIKHAQLSYINVALEISNAVLTIKISHDGQGLTNEMYQKEIMKKGAIGLKNVYNRLQLLQASINFEQATNQLFEISIIAPIQ